MAREHFSREGSEEGETGVPSPSRVALDNPGGHSVVGLLRRLYNPATHSGFKAGSRYFPAFQAFVRSCLR